jgi:uncharacterized protein (TIGR02246 family)
MKTKPLFMFGCIALFSFAFIGTASAADTKIEQTLRDLDAQWCKAAEAKDLDKTVSFYSDDATVLPANAPAATAKDAIRSLWKGELDGATSISWTATRVEVAKSGDMACVTGTYDFTLTDGTKDRGKYCEVWEKQKDGKWKCGTDIWNSDLPAPAPSEKK